MRARSRALRWIAAHGALAVLLTAGAPRAQEAGAPGAPGAPLDGSAAARPQAAPGTGLEARPEGRRLVAGDELPAAASPSLAVAADGTAFAVFAVDDEIQGVLSTDGGGRFSAPFRVGSAGRLESGLARGPRAAAMPDRLVVAAICGETLRGQDGNLLAWRSDDRGRSWKGPVRVNDVVNSAREGLFALAASPEGALVAVWLDLRHEQTQLWGAWSDDGGKTWGANIPLYASPDGSICECCAPSVTFDPTAPGEAVVLWRNSLGGNRDMYALVVKRGETPSASKARPLDTHHWALQACPMAGGGVAVSSQGTWLTFWRREQGLYTSAPGLGEVHVGDGRETAAAAGPEGFHLVWTDGQGRVLTALARAVTGGLEAAPLGQGLNAVVAGAPDGRGPVLAAWETGEGGPASLRYSILSQRKEPAGP